MSLALCRVSSTDAVSGGLTLAAFHSAGSQTQCVEPDQATQGKIRSVSSFIWRASRARRCNLCQVPLSHSQYWRYHEQDKTCLLALLLGQAMLSKRFQDSYIFRNTEFISKCNRMVFVDASVIPDVECLKAIRIPAFRRSCPLLKSWPFSGIADGYTANTSSVLNATALLVITFDHLLAP